MNALNKNYSLSLYGKHCKILLLFIFTGLFSLHAKEMENSILEKENTTTVKNNDVYVMDAAMVDPYGKAYFFVGKFYHKYNMSSKRIEKVSPIVTSSFKKLFSNVDAAFVHPKNKKGFIFKGNMYYRYNFKTKKIEKESIISDGFKGLQGPFDAALVHPTNNSAYFFKDKKYYRYSFSKKKVDKVGIIGTDGWKGIPKNADAALVHKGKAYFFKDDTYYRYDFAKRKTNQVQLITYEGYDKIWHNIFPHIDAAINTKKFRYFLGKSIVGLETYTPDRKPLLLEVPELRGRGKRIGDIYKGTPSNIDAVITHPKNNRVYFFKQGQYFRYDKSLRKVDKIGTIGHDGWKKIPASLDGAFPHKNGKVYFFKGTKYYRFNLDTHKIDKVASIKDNWKGVPDNIDAVCNKAYNKNIITFYKKSVEYVYDISKKKVVKWNFINKIIYK